MDLIRGGEESEAVDGPVANANAAQTQQPQPIADWMVTAIVLEGTLNVVRLVIMPRFMHKGHEVVIVGDYVLTPQLSPMGFRIIIDNAAAAAGRAVAGFLKGGKTIGINPQAVMNTIDLVVEAVKRKLAGGLLSPDGKTRQISGVEKNGVMKGDLNEFLNLKANALQIPDEEEPEAEIPPEAAPRELKLDF